MSTRYDCIVIGAGHNGLTCAAYLARAGRSVLVLEAAGEVGGAAVTREFAPGYRVSACAHLLHLMPPALVRELGLTARGLTLAASELPTWALSPTADARCVDPATPVDFAPFPRDATALREHHAQLARLARALHALMQAVPPRLEPRGWPERLELLRLGFGLRRLGRVDLRELLRIGAMPVWDLLEERFQSETLQGALALDAVLGTNYGPRSPGTVFSLLYRLAAAGTGHSVLAQPAGGLGALTGALARSARDAGAVIRTRAAVARIRVVQDRAAGVVLDSGEELAAHCVLSSADPKTTFLKLLGAEHLDTGFVRRIDHLRSRGLTAKLHLALDGLPRFRGVSPEGLRGRLLLAPSLGYIERAFNASKYGECSHEPIMEVLLPSLNDPSLAPAGGHVLSAVVQYVPYAPAAGWEAARPVLLENALSALERCAPGLRARIEAAELLTPADLEREFRMTGGHWHHGELALDQFFMLRPVPGAARYSAPLPGLYLCGAGAHPGGGVMGLAGRNAARALIREAA